MKVLFVSSGNSFKGISPIIKNQGESLKRTVDVDFFIIKGKGMKTYLGAIPKLRKCLKENDYDIVHSHFSLSSFVAALAGAKPLVVSLMGSDVLSKGLYKQMIKFFYFFFWDATIVKSKEMSDLLALKNVYIIPNGVDFDKFKPFNRLIGFNEVRWDKSKKHILFPANPKRPEKNFKLAKEAISLINSNEIELKFIGKVPNERMPYFYNASDVLLLTSFHEGSPNVIKEAMACNIPIVSTAVGDVKKVIGETEGCFITTFEPEDIAKKLKKALDYGKRTNGRYNIKYLESSNIAKKIVDIYKRMVNI